MENRRGELWDCPSLQCLQSLRATHREEELRRRLENNQIEKDGGNESSEGNTKGGELRRARTLEILQRVLRV